MQFDQDTIKDLAVNAVQQFISNKVPLDESIADKARSLQLNEDQVRRVVESTNVIAFLKLREGADDKTFEFEVASFPGVMNALMGGASDMSDYVEDEVPDPEMQKVAFDLSVEVSVDQSHQMLFRAHRHVLAEIEKVAQEHYNCVSDLERFVPVLVKQANWQERLEHAAGDDFNRIMNAFGKSGFEKAASLQDMVFVGKELEVATHVVELIKQAADLQAKRIELEGLEKQALMGLGKLLTGAAKLFGKSAVSEGASAGEAKLLGYTAGGPKLASKAAPPSLGSKIFNGAKYFAKNPVAGTAAAATAIPAAAAKAGIKAGAAATSTLKKSAISAGTLATVGITSATYTPPVNPRTGRPNDVLNNIYD